jgi:hypothetical protein
MKNEKEDKKLRYSTTTVRDRKNLQRTMNTFYMKSNYINMKKTILGTYNFTYYTSDKYMDYKNLIYSTDTNLINLSDTDKLLEANATMFEHKKYQPYIENIINESKVMTKNLCTDELVETNNLLSREEKIITFHTRLEELSGRKLSERFVKKLYTTLRNKVLFPILYSPEYKTSMNYEIPCETYLETMMKEYYREYNKHKYLLENETKEEFTYWHSELLALEDGYEMNSAEIIGEWNDYIHELVRNKTEEHLLKCIKFLGTLIQYFILEDDYWDDELNEPIDFPVYRASYLSYYDLPIETLRDGTRRARLKYFIEITTAKPCKDIEHYDLVYVGLNNIIPKDEQIKIFNVYSNLDYRKSVFDFTP